MGEEERLVLEALGWERATLDDVARRAGLGLPTVIVALESLIRRGDVVREGGVLRRPRRRSERERAG
jgi:DNA-binding IclR family transcriptional regulator